MRAGGIDVNLNIDFDYTKIAKKECPIIDQVYVDDEFVAIRYQLPDDAKFAFGITVMRRDGAPIEEWRILQAVKNRIAGEDQEAVLVFPAESRAASPVNEYALFVLPHGTEIRPKYAPMPPSLGKLYSENLAPAGR